MPDETQPDVEPQDSPEAPAAAEQPEPTPDEVNALQPGSDEKAKALQSEENLRQPLRNRNVHEDQEPIATHEVEGTEVVDRYHKPGAPVLDEADRESSATFAEQQAAETEVLEDARRPFSRPAVDVRSPETAYATKDNIVHPGPLGAAVRDEQVAQALVGEDAQVEIDPTLVADQLEGDETADERLDAAREEFRVDDEQVASVHGVR